MKLLAQTGGSIKDTFGTIQPPKQLQPFIDKGGTGAGGISFFLNNLITLIYIVGAIIFVFMLLWGALEWIMSGGEKEKVGNAQKRITHALIGITLMAIAFAILKAVGTFLGFEFFSPSLPVFGPI